MRSSGVLIPVFLVLAAGFAQTVQPPGDKPATVEGIVSNAVTGDPIPRAHIMLFGTVKNEAKTFGAISKADGTFSMPGLPAGNFMVQAECTGFVAIRNFGGPNSTRIQVSPGDTKSDVKVKLTPNGAITGRVVDSDGQPVEFATVQAEGMGSASNSTDDKGQFRLGGLTPGKYTVRAWQPNMIPAPPEIRTDGTAEVHYAQTWFPSSLDEKGASRVQLAAGAEASIEIKLIRAPILGIKGKVVGMPAGVQNASVQVYQGNSSRSGSQVKPDGKFELWRVDPGKYRLRAGWSNPGGQWVQTAEAEVDISDSNIEGVELRYVAPADISGSVQYDDEQARPPDPTAKPTGPQTAQQRFSVKSVTQLGLRPPLGSISMNTSRRVDVSPDGSFTFQQVGPGRYVITPTWGPVYVKSLRLGDTEMPDGILDLRNGAGNAALTVVLSSAVGQISGTVTDSNGPVASATIALVPANSERNPSFGNSRADGTYTIPGIPPGSYKIAVVDTDEMQSIGRGKGFQDSAQTAEEIEIHPKDKITKDFKK